MNTHDIPAGSAGASPPPRRPSPGDRHDRTRRSQPHLRHRRRPARRRPASGRRPRRPRPASRGHRCHRPDRSPCRRAPRRRGARRHPALLRRQDRDDLDRADPRRDRAGACC
ncbi:hypothetical protein [Brachybacterium sp. GPGPB12]|uniref:hypothetical protein n=1 Tax=Brachybacterium sp. GPGPB12 TaxID=3023517 RepID=UPI0031344DB2